MPAQRYFVDDNLVVDNVVSLAEQELHHFLHVMRTQVGEHIEIINGQGILAKGEVIKASKKEALLKIHAIVLETPPPLKVILAQAIPRINRLDFIVEKGTELGMTALWLFPGWHSERKMLTEHQLERLNSLCIAATKQCGRLWLPEIAIMPPVSSWPNFQLPAYFGDLSETAPWFASLLSPTILNQGIVFVTGPESGFDQREEEQLATLGAQGVKLHPNILRTDTASLAALSLITCSCAL